MPAQPEEVVVQPNRMYPEQRFPDRGHRFLDWIRRRLDDRASKWLRGGSRSAVRSTLPLGDRGNRSIGIIVDGIM